METALYLPVKRFLENLGFTVKGEIGRCDLVALSGDEPPIVVIGELKLSFNLELLLQAVDRAGACDEVWLAARMSMRGKGRESDARYRNLCRRLGFGMLAVTTTGNVKVIVEPPDQPAPIEEARPPDASIGAARATSDGWRTRPDRDRLSPAGAAASALSRGHGRCAICGPPRPMLRKSCTTFTAGSIAPGGIYV